MAIETHIHDGLAWRKAKAIYVHDGSAWREVKKVWCNDGTAWRLVFSKGGWKIIVPTSITTQLLFNKSSDYIKRVCADGVQNYFGTLFPIVPSGISFDFIAEVGVDSVALGVYGATTVDVWVGNSIYTTTQLPGFVGYMTLRGMVTSSTSSPFIVTYYSYNNRYYIYVFNVLGVGGTIIGSALLNEPKLLITPKSTYGYCFGDLQNNGNPGLYRLSVGGTALRLAGYPFSATVPGDRIHVEGSDIYICHSTNANGVWLLRAGVWTQLGPSFASSALSYLAGVGPIAQYNGVTSYWDGSNWLPLGESPPSCASAVPYGPSLYVAPGGSTPGLYLYSP